MSSCSIGASTVNVSQSNFDKRRVSNVLSRTALRMWTGPRQLPNPSMDVSCKPVKASVIRCCLPLEAESTSKSTDSVEETKPSGSTNQLAPSSSEVEFLVKEICNTSIAEFELKLGEFRLYVSRNVTDKNTPLPPPAPLPASASVPSSVEAPNSNGSVSSTSLAITKQVPSTGGIEALLDSATDEGLAIVQSPRVGFFRRSRTIKGKKAPPSCKENQIVQEGQVVCYVEQFGGELPVESDISGEVIKILRKDGEPVGYGDALIAILPSFPGIKKLQ